MWKRVKRFIQPPLLNMAIGTYILICAIVFFATHHLQLGIFDLFLAGFNFGMAAILIHMDKRLTSLRKVIDLLEKAKVKK